MTSNLGVESHTNSVIEFVNVRLQHLLFNWLEKAQHVVVFVELSVERACDLQVLRLLQGHVKGSLGDTKTHLIEIA